MGDRDLTLDFFGHDVSASAVAEKLAAKLKVLEAAQNDNSRAAAELDKNLKKAGDSAAKAHSSGFKPLLDSAIFLGPALVPIAAGAVAASVSLAGLGAAGLLAFMGIKKEIQDSTALGKQYETAFKPVVDEFHTLEHIAAANVFGGLTAGIREASSIFPQVNKDVALLSADLGKIAGNVGAGLVSLFHQLNPLFLTFADQLVKGSAAFATWSSGSGGVTKFVQYAQDKLPQVEKLIGNIAVAIGHIAAAAAPLGGATLDALNLLAEAIAKIPIPVLTAMIVALQVGRLASIASGLAAIGEGATAAAGGLKALGAAGAVAALAPVAAVVATVGAAVESLVRNFQDVPDLGVNIQRIVQGIGNDSKNYGKDVAAFGASIKDAYTQGGTAALDLSAKAAVAATNLGPVSTALMLTGQSTESFANALMGTDPEWKLFTQNAYDGAIASGQQGGAAKQLVTNLDQLRDSFVTNKAAGKEQADTLNTVGVSANGAATSFNTLSDAEQRAALAAEQHKQALIDLNNQILGMQTAALSATQIELQYKDSLAKATQQTKDNGTAINDNTEKGRSNQEWLLNQISTINQHYSAVLKQTGSVQQATAALSSDEQQLLASAGAAGYNTGEVQKLINKYAQVPANVSTYIKGIDGASGVIQSVDGQLRALDGRIVYTTIETQHLDIFTVSDAASQRGPAGVTGKIASGTDYWMGDWAWVGEEGPELMKVPRGSQVMSHPRSMAAVSGAPGMRVVVNVAGSVVTERQLVSAITDGIDVARRRRGRVSVLDA